MNTTKDEILHAIHSFLEEQFQKKSEKQRNQLARAKQNNDLAVVDKLNQDTQKIRNKYQADEWFAEAAKMARQLRFGSHISKGIHGKSEGDNIIFTWQPEHDYVWGGTSFVTAPKAGK